MRFLRVWCCVPRRSFLLVWPNPCFYQRCRPGYLWPRDAVITVHYLLDSTDQSCGGIWCLLERYVLPAIGDISVTDIKAHILVQAIAKLRLEIAIQEQLDKPVSELSEQEKFWKKEVERLSGQLNLYDVKSKLYLLGESINTKMCELGNNFDFEDTYKPSALRFDPETFDLWYQQDAKNRVYLRSMGSGANWLYSHLALFISLHYQFAAYSEKGCKIPPILFLDQPTQVYFPSIDDADEFDPEDLAKQAKRESIVDDDMKAVTNMFTQLAKFCTETGKTTGVTPQIIVSDHADKLILGEGYKFQDYVRATWRTRESGFIDDN